MYHHTTTIFNQLLHFVPKERFQSFVGQHRADRYTKTLTTCNQLVILLYAQATGKDSLRDIETGLRAHQNLWYHLGLKSVARSTIAYANEHRSFEIYKQLFGELLARCKEVTPVSRTFKFSNPLYALDSTTVTL